MSNFNTSPPSLASAKKKMTSRPAVIQGRVSAATNDNLAGKVACARCQITYEVPRGFRPKCPLCDAKSEVDQIRQALLESQNKLEMLTNEVGRLRSQVDLVMAIRDALEITGVEDLTFLKSVMYRYRDDRSVTLKVTHGGSPLRGRASAARANGFVAMVKGGAPEAHACSSAGGMAVAAYLAEGLRTTGPVSTMQNLIRAMNQHLPGGVR